MSKRLGLEREPRVGVAAHSLFAMKRKGVSYSARIIKLSASETSSHMERRFCLLRCEGDAVQTVEWLQS